MKKLYLLFLLLGLSVQAQETIPLNNGEHQFLVQESENNHVYLVDNPRILISFNKSSFSFLVDSISYTFFTNFGEDNHKFKILNGINDLVGYGSMDKIDTRDITLYFDDRTLAKNFRTNLVKFSPKNEIFK